MGDADDVGGLGSGQPCAPEPLRGGFRDGLRRGEAIVAKQRLESPQNGPFGLPVELLVDDTRAWVSDWNGGRRRGRSLTGPMRSISPAIAGSARRWASARLLSGRLSRLRGEDASQATLVHRSGVTGQRLLTPVGSAGPAGTSWFQSDTTPHGNGRSGGRYWRCDRIHA